MRLKIAAKLIWSGNLRIIIKNISTRINSEITSIGFERESSKSFITPNSKISFSIRPFKDSDLNTLKEQFRHERLVKERMETCYIAFDSNNNNCYKQWLIGSSENVKIKNYFGDLFPTLKEHEALIEGVYTNPDFRGLGVMPRAMSLISEVGFKSGYNRIIVFVNLLNIPSLKGCYKSGFTPYVIRKEKWFLFKRHVSFDKIPLSVSKALADLNINKLK